MVKIAIRKIGFATALATSALCMSTVVALAEEPSSGSEAVGVTIYVEQDSTSSGTDAESVSSSTAGITQTQIVESSETSTVIINSPETLALSADSSSTDSKNSVVFTESSEPTMVDLAPLIKDSVLAAETPNGSLLSSSVDSTIPNKLGLKQDAAPNSQAPAVAAAKKRTILDNATQKVAAYFGTAVLPGIALPLPHETSPTPAGSPSPANYPVSGLLVGILDNVVLAGSFTLFKAVSQLPPLLFSLLMAVFVLIVWILRFSIRQFLQFLKWSGYAHGARSDNAPLFTFVTPKLSLIRVCTT